MIRLVSRATWASGDPVSESCRPYSVRIVFFSSVDNATLRTLLFPLYRVGKVGLGRHGPQPDPIRQGISRGVTRRARPGCIAVSPHRLTASLARAQAEGL